MVKRRHFGLAETGRSFFRNRTHYGDRYMVLVMRGVMVEMEVADDVHPRVLRQQRQEVLNEQDNVGEFVHCHVK